MVCVSYHCRSEMSTQLGYHSNKDPQIYTIDYPASKSWNSKSGPFCCYVLYKSQLWFLTWHWISGERYKTIGPLVIYFWNNITSNNNIQYITSLIQMLCYLFCCRTFFFVFQTYQGLLYGEDGESPRNLYRSSLSKMKLRHPTSWTQKRETISKPSLEHIFTFR